MWPQSLPIFVPHCSRAFLRVIRPTDFSTHLTTVLHAGSLVSCYNFHSLCLCFNNLCKPGSSLISSERVTLLFDNLYPETKEAVKSRTNLSTSASVNFDSTWYGIRVEALKLFRIFKIFNRLPKIPSSDTIQYAEYYWEVVWVQLIRNNDIWHSEILVDQTSQHGTISHRSVMSGRWCRWNFELVHIK